MLADEYGVKIDTRLEDILMSSNPPAEFDVIVVIFAQIAKVEECAPLLANIKQALKPGGLLLIQGYRPEQLNYGTGGPKDVANMYTREMLEKAFDDFSSCDIRVHDSEIFEGPAHSGMSALIDFVGVR